MKTEKEKMLAGEPYDCGDTELINRWHKAKQLQKEYNDTPSDDIEKLSSLLDDLIGSRGENVWISAPFFVDYGENIHIGRNVEINMNCVFLDCNTITIGDYSGIGPGVHIYTVFHHTAPQERLGENSSFEISHQTGEHREKRLDWRWQYNPTRRNHRRRYDNRSRKCRHQIYTRQLHSSRKSLQSNKG